jgi:DNA-binding response OmpR family regulator
MIDAGDSASQLKTFLSGEVQMQAGAYGNLPEVPPADRTVCVLAVSPYEEDHACLRMIFSHSNWRIFRARDCHEAIQFASENRVAVVISERDLPDGNWKRLLELLSTLPAPPLLVVTARDADDSLWAEVLNLGAYDVLSKPLDRAEVTRIISLAWLHWKEELDRARRRPMARTASAGAASLTATA